MSRLPARLALVFFAGAVLLHVPAPSAPFGWEPGADGPLSTILWGATGLAAGLAAGGRPALVLGWGAVLASIPWLGVLLDLLLIPLGPGVPPALFAGLRLGAGALVFADAAVLLLILRRDTAGTWPLAVCWALAGAAWRLPLVLDAFGGGGMPVAPVALLTRLLPLMVAGWCLGRTVEAQKAPKHATGSD